MQIKKGRRVQRGEAEHRPRTSYGVISILDHNLVI